MLGEIDPAQVWKRPSTDCKQPKFVDSLFDFIGFCSFAEFDGWARKQMLAADDAVYAADCVKRHKRRGDERGIKALCYEANHTYSAVEIESLYADTSQTLNRLLEVCLVYEARVMHLQIAQRLIVWLTGAFAIWVFFIKV